MFGYAPPLGVITRKGHRRHAMRSALTHLERITVLRIRGGDVYRCAASDDAAAANRTAATSGRPVHRNGQHSGGAPGAVDVVRSAKLLSGSSVAALKYAGQIGSTCRSQDVDNHTQNTRTEMSKLHTGSVRIRYECFMRKCRVDCILIHYYASECQPYSGHAL